MKNLYALSFILGTVAATGCAGTVTQAPHELAEARMAFGRASGSEAPRVAPAQLHIARRALDAAEKSFVEGLESWNTRDLAYVAQRKAQVAELSAEAIVHAHHSKSQQTKQTSTEAQEAAKVRVEAEAAKKQLDQAKATHKQVLEQVRQVEGANNKR